MTEQQRPAILCPPCDIDLHSQCWWFDGDETADGPCECGCHADHVRFVGGRDSGPGRASPRLRLSFICGRVTHTYKSAPSGAVNSNPGPCRPMEGRL